MQPKCHGAYACDVIVFDEHTEMAESEIKQNVSKIAGISRLIARTFEAVWKENDKTASQHGNVSNTVTSQAQFSYPVSLDTFYGKI